MLSQKEFDAWCCELNLPEQTRVSIEHIRQSDPSRRVGGRRGNVSGQYPSRKMGVTIQFESHKVELPFIYELEHDKEVLEFYDQPPPFKLSYQSLDGRNLGHYYTPDFFVIRTNSAGWVECKTEQELQKLAEKNPNRYCQTENGKWSMPPGQKYAEEFGLFFQVWVDTDLNWNLYRNLQFLEDYYRSQTPRINEINTDSIKFNVSKNPGISLAQLLSSENANRDIIYLMIMEEMIYVDLAVSLLTEPERCFIFKDKQTARAYQLLVSSRISSDISISPTINIERGVSVIWDSRVLTIELVGRTEILFHTEHKEPVELSIDTFKTLANQGKITGLRQQPKSVLSEEIMEILLGADEKDLEKANYRLELIQPYLDKHVPDTNPQARNIRNLKNKYQLAENKHGYGYLGLISFDHAKGNRVRKIPDRILEIIEKFIKEKYETYKQQTKNSVYSEFVAFCSQEGIIENEIPTYKTFSLEIKRRSGQEQTLKRKGRRAAYAQEPSHLLLTMSVPSHGDRPFHICHIDHTLADIELRDSETGKNLGKAWITFLVDAYDRNIKGIFATFDPPSYRSCMMVIRDCVRRHGRLPQIIVVDNGKEFHSNYFRTLAGLFEFTLKYRPPAQSHFGGVGERLFGTATTQLIYNMAGNTQITKEVRQVTKSNNPKNLAVWTLGLLYLYLSKWAEDVYANTDHPALGQTPKEAYLEGMEKYGKRLSRTIPYDENFKFLTMPTTKQGNAKVQPRLGVRINYQDYWSDAFRDPEIQGTRVDVRFDPFDSGIAYAKVRQKWVECNGFIPSLKGRSQKEIQIASQELLKRRQNYEKNFGVTAKKLGEFFSTIEAEEVLLGQRIRDKQLKEVFAIMEGKSPNLTPYLSSDKNENLVVNKSDDSTSVRSKLDTDSIIDTSKLTIFKNY